MGATYWRQSHRSEDVSEVEMGIYLMKSPGQTEWSSQKQDREAPVACSDPQIQVQSQQLQEFESLSPLVSGKGDIGIETSK